MVVSQRAINKYSSISFVIYKNKNSMGSSIGNINGWVSYSTRSRNQYMSFYLELIYEH